MKICLYEKCGKEFEPNKPKQKFCSDKCRVYWNRRRGGLKTVKVLEDGTKVQFYAPVVSAEPIEKPNIQWVKPRMPKGLSLTEQLEWREKNP